MRTRFGICLGLLLIVAAHGCQPATRYSYKAKPETQPVGVLDKPTPVPQPPEIDTILLWKPVPQNLQRASIPLVYISEEKNPIRWAELPDFWNPSLLAHPLGIVALFRPPLEAATLLAASGPTAVEIKVPRGLEDPTPYLPVENPPTLGAWFLGRQLFYDPSYLVQNELLACATCHDPATGFASRRERDGDAEVHTPSLLNVVYQKHLYWNGRGDSLEASLQRTPQDEWATPTRGEHCWPGAIKRIYNKQTYIEGFRKVYGVDPNQDNVGRALGTYLRTLLAGNSLYDRAVAEARQSGQLEPTVEHFQKVLSKRDLRQLERNDAESLQVAQDLHRGYLLFHDKVGPVPTACARCHGGPLFSDREFHNLSLDQDHRTVMQNLGRFGTLPPGKRTQESMGAYRTPSLRDVARMPPYFHPGHVHELRDAVQQHLNPRWTSYLDPLFLTPGKSHEQLKRPLVEADMDALLLYLRALISEEIPQVLAPSL